MPNTFPPFPVNPALTSHLFGDHSPSEQPHFYDNAHNSVTVSTAGKSRSTNQPEPHGWMQPTDDFLPNAGFVSVSAHFPATVPPVRLVPPPVVALPSDSPAFPAFPACATWGSHDGTTHGTVQRQRWGIILMATSGVSGCRATSSITLSPFSARLLAHVLDAVHGTALKGCGDHYSLQWGDPAEMHGRVTLHRFGIDLMTIAEMAGGSVSTTVQFRAVDVVGEISRLLFAQADAHDMEFGEGDVA